MTLFRVVASIECCVFRFFFWTKERYLLGLKHLMKWFAMRAKARTNTQTNRTLFFRSPLFVSAGVQCSCYVGSKERKKNMNLNCILYLE